MAFSLLDILFPKRCVSCSKFGAYICKNCFAKIEFIEKPICPICQRQAIGGKTHPGCKSRYGLDGLVVACRYRGPVKKAIAKIKYRWVKDIGKALTDILVDSLWKFDLPKEVVLAPIPLSVHRKNWRGFNQAELLAKLVTKSFDVEFLDALIRISEVRSQVGLGKKERRENVKGVFRIAGWVNISKIPGKTLILVDDVYTSGATMQEAANVLKRVGAKSVWAMAVALG